jgi:hypothetical protein
MCAFMGLHRYRISMAERVINLKDIIEVGLHEF